MTTLQVNFNRRKAETLNYLSHTPLVSNTYTSKMKDIRDRIGQQVSKIDAQYLFTTSHSRELRLSKNAVLINTRRDIADPEILLHQSVYDSNPKKNSLQSTLSVMSAGESTNKKTRRNTFLTVVSRLPQCKKRSESVF